jgi:hypothetical protein
MDQRNGAVESSLGEVPVRAGFHIENAGSLAGGPIEIEFRVELLGPGSCYLLVPADRMRQRPDRFSFSATFEGVPLDDPCARFPYMGGPAGVIEISAQQPWRQPLILNQFVRLEKTIDLLEPGGSGRLDVVCRRPLPLAPGKEAALVAGDGYSVEVPLSLGLHRDDEQLTALVRDLISQVRYGPREKREGPLSLLLTLRAPLAVDLWRSLLNHSDPVVVERVRRASQLAAGLSDH